MQQSFGVTVTDRGAIVLSKSISVDGYADGAIVRVVTHIHSDHLLDLSRSIRYAEFIAATPLTLDLLEALGHRIPEHKKLPMPIGMRVQVDDGVLRLVRARHIPGSVSVVFESSEFSAGYTGDFKLPGTDILRDLDVLVIDATYGLPEWIRPWQEEIEYLLADIVLDELRKGSPVHIYAYNGKIEEVMLLLREMGVDAPYLVGVRHYRVLRVLERHGYRIGDVVLESSREGWEV